MNPNAVLKYLDCGIDNTLNMFLVNTKMRLLKLVFKDYRLKSGIRTRSHALTTSLEEEVVHEKGGEDNTTSLHLT